MAVSYVSFIMITSLQKSCLCHYQIISEKNISKNKSAGCQWGSSGWVKKIKVPCWIHRKKTKCASGVYTKFSPVSMMSLLIKYIQWYK